jgi:KUP system potassium uptake protein
MSVAALGIVFGDIGTSPLYTFKTVLKLTGHNPDASAVLGCLSLILWTLFLITRVPFAMNVEIGLRRSPAV